jgi:hypothetical protein
MGWFFKSTPESLKSGKDIMGSPENTEYDEAQIKEVKKALEDLEKNRKHDIVVYEKEKGEYRGGSYGELKEEGYGWPDYEVHHIPADSATELPREDGPAIVMDYEDHRQTASCGMSKEAVEYRQKQKELISQGKFDEAFQMDIDDIHDKFGDKYDKAIAEAKEYVEKLKEEGRV